MQGASLVPLLKGESPDDWRDSLYYHYFAYPSVHMVPKHFGIRGKRYKLIRFYQFDEWEFYDLENDPDEVTNLYSDPKYSDQISTMKKQLDQLREQYGDQIEAEVKPVEWRKKMREKQLAPGERPKVG